MQKTSEIIETVDTISVEANGIKFEVDTQGDGDKLVLCLHGWPEHSITWRYQMPFLANLGYKVWAPNLRGYGNSDAPKGIKNYQIEVLMKDILGIIKASEAKEITILSHDWGALIAWYFTMRYPGELDRLVVCNVPHPGPWLKSMTSGFEQLMRSWYVYFFQFPWLPEMLSRNMHAGKFIRSGSAQKGNFNDDIVSIYDENASEWKKRTAMLNYYRAIVRGGGFYRQYKLGFPKIEVPTLMLWGEKDLALSLKSTIGTENFVEEFTIRYFKDISHFVNEDAPNEVNTMLGAFLRNQEVPQYLDIKK